MKNLFIKALSFLLLCLCLSVTALPVGAKEPGTLATAGEIAAKLTVKEYGGISYGEYVSAKAKKEESESALIVYFGNSADIEEKGLLNQLVSDYSEKTYADYGYYILAPLLSEGGKWVNTPGVFGEEAADAMAQAVKLVVQKAGTYIAYNDRVVVMGVGDGATAAMDFALRLSEDTNGALAVERVLTVGGTCDADRYVATAKSKELTLQCFIPLEESDSASLSAVANILSGDKNVKSHFSPIEVNGNLDAALDCALNYGEPSVTEWATEEFFGNATYRISCSKKGQTDGGTLSAPEKVMAGKSASVAITVNDGYRINDVYVNGEQVGIAALKKQTGNTNVYTYVFDSVSGDCGIEVEFALDESAAGAGTGFLDEAIYWLSVIALIFVVIGVTVYFVSKYGLGVGKTLSVLIAVVLVFSSCELPRADADKGETDSAAESTATAVSEETPEVSVLTSELDEETEKLVNAAKELLLADAEVIDLFANLSLAEQAEDIVVTEYGYKISEYYYTLPSDCIYSDYETLSDFVHSVYTAESGVAEEYLTNWPRRGRKVFLKTYEGNTEFCYIYDAEFDTDFASGDVYYTGMNGDNYCFVYSKGSSVYNFEMTGEDGEYKLTDSIFFIDEEIRINAGNEETTFENKGSAATLRGDCLWINVFVNDGYASWSEEEREKAIEKVEAAAEHIRYYAGKFGADDLNLETLYIGFETSQTMAVDYTNAYWARQSFSMLSWGSIDNFVKDIPEVLECDNYSLMFHFNRYGRCFAVPYDKSGNTGSDIYYETTVVYNGAKGDGEYYMCPSVYEHEFLHSYGALDLYEEQLTAKGNALAEAYFPYDIMRVEPEDISCCYIGELTAKLIGWIDYIPDQYAELVDETVINYY